MDDVEVKRSGSRTPLIVAACALMFGLFIGLGIGVAMPPSPNPPSEHPGRRLVEDEKKHRPQPRS